MSAMQKLLETLPQAGRVEWIGLRPARRTKPRPVEEAEIRVGEGLIEQALVEPSFEGFQLGVRLQHERRPADTKRAGSE